MNNFQKLTTRRTQIIREIEALGSMRMGSITQQRLPYKRADGSTGHRGPYSTYTFKNGGKTRGKHLRSQEESDLYKHQIQNYRRFQELSAELVRISQTLADLEASGEDGKKNSRN